MITPIVILSGIHLHFLPNKDSNNVELFYDYDPFFTV